MYLSTRYAKAFLEESKNRNVYDSFLKEIFKLREIFSSHSEIKEMIGSSKISSKKKYSFFKDNDFQISEFFDNLLQFLVKKNRVGILDQIIEDCYRYYLNENKIMTVSLSLSSSLEDLRKNDNSSWLKIENKIESYLKDRYKKSVYFNYKLGKIKKGIVIEFNKIVLDLSSDNFLNNFLNKYK